MECCNHPTRMVVECYDNGQLVWVQNGFDARYPECGPDPAPPAGLDRG